MKQNRRMRPPDLSPRKLSWKQTAAFTLVEVVVCLAIIGIVFGGILTGYVLSARRAEWSGYSMAAEALSIQQLEQARAAVWDMSIGKNELLSLNLLGWTNNAALGIGKGYSVGKLDLPYNGTNWIVAVNYVTIRMLNNVSGVSGVSLQMVQVDTVWTNYGFNGKQRVYTNSTATYFAPDNRDASSL